MGVNTSQVQKSQTHASDILIKKNPSSVERILESYGAQINKDDTGTASLTKAPTGDLEPSKIKSALVNGVPAMEIFKSLLQQQKEAKKR